MDMNRMGAAFRRMGACVGLVAAAQAVAYTDDLAWLVETPATAVSADFDPQAPAFKNASYGVLSVQFVPSVIPPGYAGSVRVELRMNAGLFTGAPTWSLAGTTYTFNDSGSNGDLVAGDLVWTTLVPASALVQGLTESDVFRRYVGQVAVPETGGLARYNLFAQVATPAIPPVTVQAVSPTWQVAGHVANLVAPDLLAQAFLGKAVNAGDVIQQASQRIFQNLPNSFDFLVLAFDRTHIDNRYYQVVNRSIQGIGGIPNDLSATFGAPARLNGIVVIPGGNLLDGANTGYLHELGHHWVTRLTQPSVLASGVPHWPPSTMGNYVMGVSIPGQGAGGQFPCRISIGAGSVTLATAVVGGSAFTTEGTLYGPLDLYLMGLLPAAEVPDQVVLQGTSLVNCTPGTYTSGFTRFSIGDVVAANGPRSPSSASAPRSFRVATVVVSDQLLPATTMAYYDYFARRAAERQPVLVQEGLSKYAGAPFFRATGGRATIDPVMFAGLAVPTTPIQVVEFYNPALDRYFYTADAAEAQYLRTTPATGERETGFGFKAYANTLAPPAASLVCRFYGSVSPGPNSHFYTADPAECAALRELQAATPASQKRWNYEALAFRVALPVAGACEPGTVPVYRAYNRGAQAGRDSNHRLTASVSEYQSMIGRGWAGEGVVMCAPA